jgi:cobalt-zinc-cadmium efflux system outer membrane protein
VTELDLLAEKNVYAAAKLELVRAEVELRVQRQALDRELGVWGGRVGWTLEGGLAELPTAEWPLEHVESFAILHRLDLGAARTRLASFGTALKLTHAGLIGGLEVGAQGHRDPDAGTKVLGPSLRLELPLFDQRQATRARLHAQLRQAENSLDELAIRVRTEVRMARERVLASRELAEFYKKTALPLREREIAVTQLYYNAMQVGLFQLLGAKQRQVSAYREYLDCVRDYWLARVDLERAAGGPLGSPDGEKK